MVHTRPSSVVCQPRPVASPREVGSDTVRGLPAYVTTTSYGVPATTGAAITRSLVSWVKPTAMPPTVTEETCIDFARSSWKVGPVSTPRNRSVATPSSRLASGFQVRSSP